MLVIWKAEVSFMNTDGSAVNSVEQRLISIYSKSDRESNLDGAINGFDDSDKETISVDGRPPLKCPSKY